MSRDMINAVVIGRLTKDPELKMTTSGTTICPFTVAVNRYRNEKTETVYIECISFGKIAEGISKNFKRGLISQSPLIGGRKRTGLQPTTPRDARLNARSKITLLRARRIWGQNCPTERTKCRGARLCKPYALF